MAFDTIAFFNGIFPYGGGEIVTSNLSEFFFKQGIKIILYAEYIEYSKLTEEHKKMFIFRELPEKGNLKSCNNCDFILNSIKQDGVQCLIIQGIIGFPIEVVKNNTDCKIIYCCHSKPMYEVDVLRLRTLKHLPNPTFARKLEWFFIRKPVYYFTDKLEKRFMRRYCTMLQNVDKMLLLCEEYKNEFEILLNKNKYGNHKEKLFSIINPLLSQGDIKPCDLIKEKVVLYVGRLSAGDKRVDRLIEIWGKVEKKNPEWKLKIIGTGDEEYNLKQLVEKLDLRNIEFIGYVNNVSEYYRTASFVCLTSNIEGLPMGLMEGQQYGAIPVSFDSYSGIRMITQNGECGVMIPSYNKTAYAKTLNVLLNDAPIRKEMSIKSFEASKRYDLNTVGNQWIDLFNSL